MLEMEGKEMKGPIVSVDVSKGESHYQGFKELNVKYSNVRKIKHDKQGLNELLKLIKEMEQSLNCEVCVVYEATGVYHCVLKKFLDDHNVKQFIINPLLSAKTRKNDSLRSPKTDKLDPKSIAKTFYNQNLYQSSKSERIYHELRELSRYYEDVLVHIRKDKVAFRAQLDIVFPGYDTLFADLYGPVSLTIIEKYPHPEMIVNKSVKTVSKIIQKKTYHGESVSQSKAIKAIEFSKTVYSGCNKDDIEVNYGLLVRRTNTFKLSKIKGVIDKNAPENLRESILVLDANTGQNGLQQAKVFKECVSLTAVALTKLDGSAKGAIILAIAKDLRLPVKLVGVGEKMEDLKDFDSKEFINALFN
jgi:hypothetical protein